jgi:hypothetical protein
MMKMSAMIVMAPAVRISLDIVGETRDEAADGVAVVEGDGHSLEVPEELEAEIVHHLLGDDHHLDSLRVPEDEPDDEHHRVQASDPGEAVRLAPGDVTIDGLLDEEGLQEREPRRRQQQDEGENHAPGVRAHVRQEAPDEA